MKYFPRKILFVACFLAWKLFFPEILIGADMHHPPLDGDREERIVDEQPRPWSCLDCIKFYATCSIECCRVCSRNIAMCYRCTQEYPVQVACGTTITCWLLGDYCGAHMVALPFCEHLKEIADGIGALCCVYGGCCGLKIIKDYCAERNEAVRPQGQ